VKGIHITNITVETARDIINQESIVMLPIGGGSKSHGNHLPMGTDYFVTDWIAKRVTEKFELICLPTLPYAHFPAFIDWPGSVSVDADSFIQFVKDILLNFVRFGVKKFVILDGGITTRPPMMILATTMNNDYGVKVAVTNIAGLGKEVQDEVCEQERGTHGDEAETSCMLHINSSLVHMGKAVEEYSPILPGSYLGDIEKVYVPVRLNTPTGTNGNSRLATAQKGERILNAMVDDLLVFLNSYKYARFIDS